MHRHMPLAKPALHELLVFDLPPTIRDKTGTHLPVPDPSVIVQGDKRSSLQVQMGSISHALICGLQHRAGTAPC
jgi:hypothetical protein